MAVAAVAGASLLFLPGLHGAWQAAKSAQQLAGETERVEQASQALQKLEAENKKFSASLQQLELALSLEKQRLRWPRLLQELRRHTPKKLWITSLKVLPAEEGTTAPEAGKAGSVPAPVVEIGGMFETQSAVADAEAVANFQKALEAGGVLLNVTVVERETPLYVDGKTDQVALKFRLKADWPWQIPEKAPAAGAAP